MMLAAKLDVNSAQQHGLSMRDASSMKPLQKKSRAQESPA
jgi:hypothetical protein